MRHCREQEARFYHGYYDHYCYLPLYVFAGEHVLCARLRPSNIDPSAGSRQELERIVKRIRARWPEVKIVLRGDAGFCREELMAWCEANQVDYVFGMARNHLLEKMVTEALEQARRQWEQTQQPARVFLEFEHETVSGTWSRRRRVVAKAEHIDGKSNPRFIVTSLGAQAGVARQLYEELYCARGDMGVSRKGHICQLVRDQPGLKDSSPVAGEASWRESKATEPSDNILERSMRNAPGCNVQ